MIDEKKLIEDIENMMSPFLFADEEREWALKDVIEVIENQPKVGEWIPCSERLPEEHKSLFYSYYGTDKWNNAMWNFNSDDVLVTFEFENGEKKTNVSHTNDGKWKIERELKLTKCKVIAWQPLPEPFKGD